VRRTHWCGEDVQTIDTTLEEVPAHLPVFDRSPLGANRFRDLITRRATGDGEALQIDTVSKKYVLVQHADPIRAVSAQIRNAGINPAHVPARLLISEYGARMALRATLPKRYDFMADDGHSMGLTFECFNSVDGSVPLFAAVGWFRFVCSNGLVVGTASAKVRQRHLPPLNIDQISEVLADGMGGGAGGSNLVSGMAREEVGRVDLARWVDGRVAKAWGPLAAARVYGISMTGLDGAPVRPFRRAAPHQWVMNAGLEVPGTHAPCADGYEIAQVLAWVAAQRANMAERLRWRGEIRGLIASLVQ
jgi:hypothetical protein